MSQLIHYNENHTEIGKYEFQGCEPEDIALAVTLYVKDTILEPGDTIKIKEV